MSFDPMGLPEKEWLKLSEVVNFLALGEALDATVQVPADRAYLPKIEAALTRCRNEVRDATRSAEAPQLIWHSDFLELVGYDDSPGQFPQSSAQLDRCKDAWPRYGQHLRNLVVEWERAHEQDNRKRAEAEQEVLQWLLSGEVDFDGMVVEGDRKGCRERIDVVHIFDPVIFWGHDRIAAHSRDGHNPRPGEPRIMLVWDEVQIKRSSLVKWIHPPAPDPARFDPMQEPYWTLPMAVVWIGSKSLRAVREQWDDWLTECGRRRVRSDGSYYREPLRKPSVIDLIGASSESKEAWGALRKALAAEELPAVRLDPARQADVSIPNSEWATVDIPATSDPEDSSRLMLDGAKLKSADVLRLWPAALTRPAVGETGTLPVRERKKPGSKPDYDWAAIEEAARRIAARPKVPGIKPATERLIAAIQKWHQTQHPNERFPGRSTLQRKLVKWGLS